MLGAEGSGMWEGLPVGKAYVDLRVLSRDALDLWRRSVPRREVADDDETTLAALRPEERWRIFEARAEAVCSRVAERVIADMIEEADPFEVAAKLLSDSPTASGASRQHRCFDRVSVVLFADKEFLARINRVRPLGRYGS
mmetsp:Transcript_19170/g.52888  ORF Transcript_19170/g.52888 Transcript_19170/m.52888 type:complete len:140 (+) Transcript_19170:2848-3267(+)